MKSSTIKDTLLLEKNVDNLYKTHTDFMRGGVIN